MKKMLKTFLRVSQGVSKVNHTQHVPRVQGTERAGLCLKDSRGLGNIPKNNLMVLKTCHGSVPQMPLCLQHKDMWECVTKPSVPLPFSRAHKGALNCVLFMATLQKGVLESIFTKNCITSRASNWWNLRRKDFQYKACPVMHHKMEPNFINSALQIPIRLYWHFQNQTGTWAPASTLVPELQHILPKQKSKQAKKLCNILFHSTWCLYNQMLFNIPAVSLYMGPWKRYSQSIPAHSSCLFFLSIKRPVWRKWICLFPSRLLVLTKQHHSPGKAPQDY